MDEYGQLDRLIGWHLLIAVEKGRTVFFRRCPAGVPAHWCAVRGETQTENHETADLIIDWQRDGGRTINVARGYGKPQKFRQYAMLPRTRPRLILPLHNIDQLRRGLKLHRPGRRSVRLAVGAMANLVPIGFTYPLKNRLLEVDVTLEPEHDINPSAVLYLGTEDIDRKTTILPPDGHRIQKYGASPLAAAAVRHEAKTLDALAKTGVASMVPKLIGLTETPNGTLLEQEFRARAAGYGAKAMPEVIQFLTNLSQDGHEIRNGIPGHRSHGDFTPWNLHLTSNGIFVFDWERSQEWAPALADAFHFSIAPFVYLQGKVDSRAVKNEALAFAARVAVASAIDTSLLPVLWKLWLMSKPFGSQDKTFRTLVEKVDL